MNSLLKTLKLSILEVLRNKFEYLFLFYNLVFFVGAVKQFETDEALIVNFIIVFLITLFSKRISMKGLFIVLIIFSLIIFLPVLAAGFNNVDIYIGSYIRILSAFLIVCYFRARLYIVFENLVFLLALLSLPLFLIQILDVSFFNLFKGISSFLLNEERLSLGTGVLTGHRYILVFLVNSWGENRNSGFAWEPAGFGAMLIWAMIINTSTYKMKLNPKFFILFFAAITTFSVGTYLALLVLIFYILVNTRVKTGIIYSLGTITFLLAIYSFSFFSEMSVFMTGKTNEYIESVKTKENENEKYVNRVQGAFAGLSAIAENPLGYGLDPLDKTGIVNSANGFMNLIFKFGIFGGILILVLLSLTFNFIKKYFYYKLSGKFFFVIILLLTLNGNPFANQPFFWAFLISGFLNSLFFASYFRNMAINNHSNGYPTNMIYNNNANS
jgi:hypothetical protein